MTQEYKETISRYEIESILGKGGMGTVYKARDPYLDKIVAVKVFNSKIKSDALRVRFQNEAKTLQKIRNSSIPEVYNFGITEEDQLYLVMEYIEGINLKQHLEKVSSLSIIDTINLTVQLCEALGYAHSLGVFHRDIKPENIILLNQGQDSFEVKLIDFGIAKENISDEEKQELTLTGQVLGSPPYMSPEQINGVNIDGRSDIYSLGCVLFEVLTGQKMFEGNTPLATVTLHVASEAPLLSSIDEESSFPEFLEDIVAKCVKKAPEDRYQNMIDLKTDLLKFFSELPTEVQKENETELSGETKDDFAAETEITGSKNSKKLILTAAILLIISVPILYMLYSSQNPDSKKQSLNFKPSTLIEPYSKFSGGSVSKLEDDTVVFDAMVGDKFMMGNSIPPSKKYKFDHSLITSEGLSKLPMNIEVLQLDGIKFDRNMPITITKRFKNLQKLSILRSEEFPSTSLSELAKCKNLISLDYVKRENESVVADEVTEIVKFKNLKHLVIQGQKLGPKAFQLLQKNSNLELLGIEDTNLTKVDMEQISKLKRLKVLTILNSIVEPDALVLVKNMNLNKLTVSRKLTQKEIPVLSNIKNLRIKNVEYRNYTSKYSIPDSF